MPNEPQYEIKLGKFSNPIYFKKKDIQTMGKVIIIPLLLICVFLILAGNRFFHILFGLVTVLKKS